MIEKERKHKGNEGIYGSGESKVTYKVTPLKDLRIGGVDAWEKWMIETKPLMEKRATAVSSGLSVESVIDKAWTVLPKALATKRPHDYDVTRLMLSAVDFYASGKQHNENYLIQAVEYKEPMQSTVQDKPGVSKPEVTVVHDFTKDMTTDQRTIFTMIDGDENLPVDEVANRLGMSKGSVTRIVSQARSVYNNALIASRKV